MHPLLQACAIVAAPMIAFGFYAIWSAPLGYEDHTGFHLCDDVHAATNTKSGVRHHGA